MFASGFALNIIGVGAFCWTIFALTIDAFPLFVAVSLGLAAFNNGAGAVGALFVGSVAARLTVAFGQLAFTAARSLLLRRMIAAIFLVPAGVAGYHASLALSHLVIPSLLWREAFAWINGVFICGAAWTRFTALVTLRPSPGSAEGSHSQPDLIASATRISGRRGSDRSVV